MKLKLNSDLIWKMGLISLLGYSLYTVFSQGSIDWNAAATQIFVYIFVSPLIILTLYAILGKKGKRQPVPILP